MRMSCNGCRVLRKGCGEGCVIRPCLQWISDPEAQGRATVFLAKFYGRAGLMNLLSEASHEDSAGVFRSLLYEACGRIVNPVDGVVSLLRSGNWHVCQAAVDAVLKGAPIPHISTVHSSKSSIYDIRHVNRPNRSSRPQFKRGKFPAKISRPSEESFGSRSSGSGEEHDSVLSTAEPALELSLGFEPAHVSPRSSSSSWKSQSPRPRVMDDAGVDLGLHLPL
ncbi:LOB domain-containing protein 41-like [Wolffia australiana]